MVGILIADSSGLILAEPCENYPNGWTFERTNSYGLGFKGLNAHSGSGAFRSDTNAPPPPPGSFNSWGSGNYVRFYKTVDLKSGANRKVKVFRGPLKAACFDDFASGSMATDRWEETLAPVTNGIAQIASGQTCRTDYYLWEYYQDYVCRMRVVDDCSWEPWQRSGGSDAIDLRFGENHGSSMVLKCFKNGETSVNLGAYDKSAFHEYRITHASGQVKLYVDDVLKTTISTNVPTPSAGNGGGSRWRSWAWNPSSEKLQLDWFGVRRFGYHRASLKLGTQTVLDIDVDADPGTKDPNTMFYDEGWIALDAGVTGSQTVELKFRNAGASYEFGFLFNDWDDLMVMLDTTITIKSLLGGQKVELYDTGGSLRKSGTCPGTGVDVVLTGIDALVTTGYGFVGYFKVYDTDGTTLLYTTASEARWGGDVYKWLPNQSKAEISATETLVYRTGSGLSPTTSVVTVTLTDKDTGAKLGGKTINWTPNLGTVNPTSNQTDANGQASTTFTAGSSAGLGGVRGSFAGDATYGASSAQQLIDVFHAQPVADATKDFQVWIAGQEVVFESGDYKLSSEFRPHSFSFTSPILTLSVGGWWAVDIYRKGVKEFAGRIFTRERTGGVNTRLVIGGVDEKIMIQRRVANKGYTDEPKLIIEDLLSRYPCGVTAGTISLYGSSIKLDATYENLYDALMQIAKTTGWKFRLNADKTLDFAPIFGSGKSITVAIGDNAVLTSRKEDWSQIDTKVFVVGKSAGVALVSTATDPTAELTYGLIEQAFLEKGIDDQGTLDLRAQEILEEKKDMKEAIGVDWIDSLATGAYVPHDTLTVTDPDIGLSGSYTIKSIGRNLLDANRAALELTNRLDTIADAMQAIRKDVKDIGVI